LGCVQLSFDQGMQVATADEVVHAAKLADPTFDLCDQPFADAASGQHLNDLWWVGEQPLVCHSTDCRRRGGRRPGVQRCGQLLGVLRVPFGSR